MTREEAVKILRREIECLSHTKCEDCILEAACDPARTTPFDSEYIEVYEMAIKALEQEPKTGHWIDTNEDGFLYHRIYRIYKCSHCGDTVCDYPENIQKYKYCHNCGAKMESEDKE